MKKYIIETSIKKLVLGSLFLALGLFIIAGLIGTSYYNSDPPEIFTFSILIISSAVASFGGFAQIVKREAPGFGRSMKPIKGAYAVLTGWLWVVLCSIAFFTGIYYVTVAILK